jgi:hypothetical protein
MGMVRRSLKVLDWSHSVGCVLGDKQDLCSRLLRRMGDDGWNVKKLQQVLNKQGSLV